MLRNSCHSAGITLQYFCPSKRFVGNIKDQVVEVIASARIIPSNQALIDVVDITYQIGKWLTNLLDLRYIGENFWIGTEVNVLTITFRLQYILPRC